MNLGKDRLSGEALEIHDKLEAYIRELYADGASEDALILAVAVLGTAALVTTYGKTGALEQIRNLSEGIEDEPPSIIRH